MNLMLDIPGSFARVFGARVIRSISSSDRGTPAARTEFEVRYSKPEFLIEIDVVAALPAR